MADVNFGLKELRELTSNLQEKNIIKGKNSITVKDGDLYGEKIISEFINIASAIWHIRYHLDNPKSPDLSPFTDTHETYLKYLENVKKKVTKIIEKAKNLDREKFEKIYNPEAFMKDIL